MEHRITAKNLKELVLKQEAEDLARLGLGHQADLVNQEYKHLTGHYLHLNKSPQRGEYGKD